MNRLSNSLRLSFLHAWRGILLAFKNERSFRIQLAIASLIITAVFIFPLNTYERVVLLLAVAAVLVLELLNSTVERMVDLFKPRLSQYVGEIKDLMAGAVLIASLFAAVVGSLILWPHVNSIFDRL